VGGSTVGDKQYPHIGYHSGTFDTRGLRAPPSAYASPALVAVGGLPSRLGDAWPDASPRPKDKTAGTVPTGVGSPKNGR